VEAGRGGRGGAELVGVHRLIALGIGQGLGDVRREGRFSLRLALETHAPAPLAEVLDQLDRAETRTGT
jgi:hypothetical protein